VKITLLPSATSGESQYSSSYLINDHVAIDAGCLGFWKYPVDQSAVRHLFLTHSHMDHIASLPIFLENIIGLSAAPVVIHASSEVLDCLRLDMFNGRVWANFLAIMHEGKPFAVVEELRSGEAVTVEGMRITPVAVNHAVPTQGFILEEANAAVVITSDTGPTEEIWKRAEQTPNLKGVFLEVTFPDSMADLAEVTRHLTPAGFVREMHKLTRPAKFLAVHLKAQYRDQVAQELLAHQLGNVEIAKFGTPYVF
jgi:ribonuclease BN (tRNA processing enzyme)